MAIALLDHLDDGEARALARFLVEVLGLDQAITSALSRFYARSDRQDEFAKHFLDRLTMGNALQRLGPVLDAHEVSDEEQQWLREVTEMRNLIAHSLPRTDYRRRGDGGEDLEPIRVWHSKRFGRIGIEELDQFTSLAFQLRVKIASLPP